MTTQDTNPSVPPADSTTTTVAPVAAQVPVIGAATNPAGPDPADDPGEDVEARLAYESLMRHRKARRRKKIVVAAVVAGLALAGVVGAVAVNAAGSQQAAQTTIATVPVYASDFSESVSATGTAQPLTSVSVTPEITDGTIATVDVVEGQSVEEGQTLFTIKSDSLDKTVRQAELTLKQAQTSYNNAKSAYYDAYNEYSALYDQDPWAADELYGGSVQPMKDAYEQAGFSLESAQDAYNEAVELAAKRTVTAPQAGQVVSCSAQVGEPVIGGQGGASSLVKIADLSQMTVKVQVNEVDISKIAVGQKAQVSFSALPGTMLDAEVTRISTVSSSDESGYNYGVVTYDVELLIPEPTAELKPGMTANVEIMMQYVADALTVPVQALATDDGENYYVYVMTDPQTQACERRDVTVGEQSSSTAVVTSGLAEGDLVVLDPWGAMAADGGAVATSDSPAA